MEFPVQEWLAHANRKWECLTSSAFRESFSASSDLSQNFQACSTQLQPEDDQILQKLSQDNLVRKDPEAAAFYKQEGNKRFQGKKYTSAALLYSKVCLEDIDRALDSGYPDQLMYKVLLRRAECLLQLQRTQEATQVLGELEEKLASQHSLFSNKFQAVLTHIKDLKALVPNHQSNGVTTDSPNDQLQDLELCSQNPKISNASSAISVHLSTAKGRHLVAAEDISLGQTLVKEEAFVSVLIPEKRPLPAYSVERNWDTEVGNEEQHCHHCLLQVIASVPCQACSYTIYCSYKCRDKAQQDYHWAECILGNILLTLGVFANLALRATLVAGFAQVNRLVQEYYRDPEEKRNLLETREILHSSVEHPGKTEDHIPGCDTNGVYHSSYQAIFSLLPHSEHQTPEHRFLCGFTAAALCRKLQEMGLDVAVVGQKVPAEQCNAATAAEWSPELRALGVAMHRHILQLQCNAQGVCTIRATGIGCYAVECREQVRVASALFPVLSLMNHSCDPNTSVSFQGQTAVVRAVKLIKEAQEVSHCYGPHCSRMRVKERLQLLRSQYFFTCQCRACLQEQESEVKSILSFCCVHCRAPLQGEDVLYCLTAACTFTADRSRLMFQLQDVQLRVSKAQELLDAGNSDQAILLLEDCRREGRSFLSPEHTVLAQIEDCLAQAHAACANWSAAAKHLQRSIQSVEAHHGSSSVELGHELFKLAQIFFNGCFLTDAVGTIAKAEHILTLHYGPQHEMVQELQQMKACVTGLPGMKAVLKGDIS